MLASGAVVRGRALIGATGSHYRRLDAEGVDELGGAGVYYGSSPSEAAFHRGGDVFIVGGANSAGQAALHLASYARSVTLSSAALARRAHVAVPRRALRTPPGDHDPDAHQVARALGDGKLERLVPSTSAPAPRRRCTRTRSSS